MGSGLVNQAFILAKKENKIKNKIKASNTLKHQPTVWPVTYACTQPFHPGSTMLIRPNKAETAVHGCHCPGDIAVRMRKVLATPWVGIIIIMIIIIIIILKQS